MKADLERVLTNKLRKDDMISFVNSNPDQFEDVVKAAISNQIPHGWRATWVLGHCMKKNDERIQPYINKLIKSIPQKKDGHQRELIKVLNKMKLKDTHEGLLFDACMNIWEDISKSSSVRIFAFQYIFKIANSFPELKKEILFLTNSDYSESLSPAIRKSFYKMRKQLVNSN